jgi:hypothetical protein
MLNSLTTVATIIAYIVFMVDPPELLPKPSLDIGAGKAPYSHTALWIKTAYKAQFGNKNIQIVSSGRNWL